MKYSAALLLIVMGVFSGCQSTTKTVEIKASSIGYSDDILGNLGVSLGELLEIEGVFAKEYYPWTKPGYSSTLSVTWINGHHLAAPIEIQIESDSRHGEQRPVGTAFRFRAIEWATFESNDVPNENAGVQPPHIDSQSLSGRIGDRFWRQQMSTYIHVVAELPSAGSKTTELNNAPLPALSVTPTADTPVALATTAAQL